MYEELKCRQLIEDLKKLVEKAEEANRDDDIYCDLMKTMILNTYSAN